VAVITGHLFTSGKAPPPAGGEIEVELADGRSLAIAP